MGRPIAGAQQERVAARAVRICGARHAKIPRAVGACAYCRRGRGAPPNKRALLRWRKRGVAAPLNGLGACPKLRLQGGFRNCNQVAKSKADDGGSGYARY